MSKLFGRIWIISWVVKVQYGNIKVKFLIISIRYYLMDIPLTELARIYIL